MSPPIPPALAPCPSPEDLGYRLSETLHAIALRILLVDARSTLLYANHAGHAALQNRSGLALHCGYVCAIAPFQQAPLDRAIGAAARGKRSLVELGQAKECRLVAVIPLGGDPGSTDPMVLLLSGQCDPLDPIVLTLFAKTTGLTPSERDVLVALCEGVRPQDIARQRSVSLATVRTQIGAIRGKVGARTIAHVVRKVSTLPPMRPFRAPAADHAHLLHARHPGNLPTEGLDDGGPDSGLRSPL